MNHPIYSRKNNKYFAKYASATSNRVNRACRYFPCHKGLEDCTFCYCPFYPCMDKGLGKLKGDIWSCQDCSWIHKRKVVNRIFSLVKSMKNRPLVNNNKTGIIIISHGSRLENADNAIHKTIKTIKSGLDIKNVVPAYLQFSRLNLSNGIQRLVNKNCEKIIIVPFFLLNGQHVTRDIPRVIKKEKTRYPKVKFVCTGNLGKDKRITDIVIDRINEYID